MSQKYILHHLSNPTIPPDEHALYKDNFATGNGKLKKVIADIAHSVMEMCYSCFVDTKYKCLRCELLICNKCSVFEENGDVAYCEACDTDLKRATPSLTLSDEQSIGNSMSNEETT